MTAIAIIGYGAFGKQVYQIAKLARRSEPVMVFDDYAAGRVNALKARPFRAYRTSLDEIGEAYVGLGYKHLEMREAVLAELRLSGVNCPAVVHESGIVAKSAKIEPGTYVYAGSLLDEDVVLCAGAILNNRVTVSHDSFVGGCSFLAPGVVICGNVRIGSRTFIGAGSVITNGVTIGDDVIIGAGSLVATDVASGMSVVGNPLRCVTTDLEIL